MSAQDPTPYTYPSSSPPRPCSYKPVLQTPRLTLLIGDPLDPAHTAFSLRCLTDPVAVAAMGDFGLRTAAQMQALNAATQLSAAHTPLGQPTTGLPYYIVCRKGAPGEKEGEWIGMVSLASRGRAVPPDMGWLMLAGHHGKGYATEAGEVFLRYFLHEFQGGLANARPPIGIIAWPNESNTGSVRVAVKLGMVEMGEVDAGDDKGGNVVYGVPGMGINGGKRFTTDTKVNFFGEGELGKKAMEMILGLGKVEE